MVNKKHPGYQIGVSSGHHRPPQTMYFSLTGKFSNIATWGVNYTQVDIEDLSEISKNDIIKTVKHIVNSLGIRYGMHAEINETVGFDISIKQNWDSSHTKIHEYLDTLYDFFYDEDTGKLIHEDYIPDYIDFHVSYGKPIKTKASPDEIKETLTSTPWGEPDWSKFLEQDGNDILLDWFLVALAKPLFTRLSRAYQDPYEQLKDNWITNRLKKDIPDFQENLRNLLQQNQMRVTNIVDLFKDISDIGITDQNLKDFIKKCKEEIRICEKISNKLKRGELYDEFEKNDNLDNIEIKREDGSNIDVKEYLIDKKDIQKGKEIKDDENGRDRDDCLGLLSYLYREWLHSGEKMNYKGIIIGENYVYALMAKYLRYIQKNKIKSYKLKNENHSTKKYKVFWDIFINHEVNSNGKFTKLRNEKTLKEIMTDLSKRHGKEKIRLVEPDGTVHIDENLVAMVASFYILTHFEIPITKTDLEYKYREVMERKGKSHMFNHEYKNKKFIETSPIDKLRAIGKLKIVFENPHVMQNIPPAEQRIIKGIHMEKLARCAEELFKKDGNYLYLLLDFGWWQSNGMIPEDQVKEASNEFGKYVKAIQLHYAYGLLGNHYTIEIGGKAHERIYEWMYLLQKKGLGQDFGPDVNYKVPIVFERGGGQNPLEVVRTSVFAMRNIVEQLETSTDPNKLPASFYGIDMKGYFSPERQLASIREHAFDPIKGMLKVKEFEHTFTGGHALSGGKRPDEYIKERYK